MLQQTVQQYGIVFDAPSMLSARQSCTHNCYKNIQYHHVLILHAASMNLPVLPGNHIGHRHTVIRHVHLICVISDLVLMKLCGRIAGMRIILPDVHQLCD